MCSTSTTTADAPCLRCGYCPTCGGWRPVHPGFEIHEIYGRVDAISGPSIENVQFG